jgi:hypothetical protein
MRALLLAALALTLALLAGCPYSSDCVVNDDCGGHDVCARNGECLAPSEVRAVRVTWTIRGQQPSTMNCGAAPNFYILFGSFDYNDTYGYEPVPCASGVFSVDKLPSRYNSVELGADGRFSQMAVFNAQGQATFDLMP